MVDASRGIKARGRIAFILFRLVVSSERRDTYLEGERLGRVSTLVGNVRRRW